MLVLCVYVEVSKKRCPRRRPPPRTPLGQHIVALFLVRLENYPASEHPNLVRSITGYKSSWPTEAGKHRTIGQAIKVAGPQRQASTGQ